MKTLKATEYGLKDKGGGGERQLSILFIQRCGCRHENG